MSPHLVRSFSLKNEDKTQTSPNFFFDQTYLGYFCVLDLHHVKAKLQAATACSVCTELNPTLSDICQSLLASLLTHSLTHWVRGQRIHKRSRDEAIHAPQRSKASNTVSCNSY